MMRAEGVRPVALVSFALSFLATLILAPEVRGESDLCATLLTNDEVKTALGRPLSEDSPTIAAQSMDGTSTCYWTTSGAEPAVYITLMFHELEAIREAMVSAGSVSDFFDMNVSSTTDRGGVAPEMLKDVGVRAALFSESEAQFVYIETVEGFVHLSAIGATRAQIEELARAVAPPKAKSK
jgi:hypothetical protein